MFEIAAVAAVAEIEGAGALGAVASIVATSAGEAAETVAGRVGRLRGERVGPCAQRVLVIDQLPPVAVAVPSTVVPSVSYSVTVRWLPPCR